MKHIKNNTGAIVGLVLIVGVAGFFGGMKYEQMQQEKTRSTRFQSMGFGNQSAQANGSQTPGQPSGQTKNSMGGRPVTGEVISKDDGSITIKTQDGGSKIIILSGSTIYSKTMEGTKDDVSVGSQINIVGTENQDKSITAQSVQLNPMMQMRRVSE